jgi:S1-C subfamily serine protease
LINYVALQAPNTEIQVEVVRGDQKVNLTVKVGERKPVNNDSQFIPLPKR